MKYFFPFLLLFSSHLSAALPCCTIPEDPFPWNEQILSLDVYVHRQTIHILTSRYDEASAQNIIEYQNSKDSGKSWSKSTRVDEGKQVPHARGRGTDFHLAVTDEAITAVWLTKGTGFGERGPLVAARSTDEGKTWSTIPTPADDRTNDDHAFIDVTATPNGAFHTVWLDTRSGDGKGLYLATSNDHGETWESNVSIDSKTCECCWNTLKSDSTGVLYALYRDTEPRDMALARSVDNGKTWDRLSSVGAFDWQFIGCPHAGGGLAIEDASSEAILHALVWTGQDDHAGLHYLKANASDLDWSSPLQLGSDNAKAADIAINDSDQLLATWVETDAKGSTLMYSTSNNQGAFWSSPQVIDTPNSSPSHPRVLSIDDEFHLFWTSNYGLKHLQVSN
ncbi:glycoside hydrolase [Puniceicoccaceae bacterium K14]|nr:glycoside hydrolase [Puniceicoccaceae bacterium K14]